MIPKAAEYKHGYVLAKNSTDDDFQEIIKSYGDKYHCLICNSNTAKNFRIGFLGGYSTITINEKLADGVFFINGVF